MALQLGPVIGQVGGGRLKEVPVSMSGGGERTYPLTTIDAGAGALIVVTGVMSAGSTSATSRPHVQIGAYTDQEPHLALTGTARGIVSHQSGTVAVSIVHRHIYSSTTFTGTVYVAYL